MLRYLSLADKNGAAVTIHETTKRHLTNVQGLVGVSAIRENRRVRPTAHGGIDESKWEDGRLIVLEGEAWGDTQADAYSEFRTITKPMLETLENGAALLKWGEGDTGLELQRKVRLASEVDPPLREAAALLLYQAQLYATDPRAYAQTQQSAQSSALSQAAGGATMPTTFPITFNESSGGLISNLVVGGNRATPPVFRVHGACSSARIKLVGTTKEIIFTGTISVGTYLEIDVFERTVRLNGLGLVPHLLDAANTVWFELPPGTHNLQLLASSFNQDAKLEVFWRNAYA